jgi:hypothetical protein
MELWQTNTTKPTFDEAVAEKIGNGEVPAGQVIAGGFITNQGRFDAVLYTCPSAAHVDAALEVLASGKDLEAPTSREKNDTAPALPFPADIKSANELIHSPKGRPVDITETITEHRNAVTSTILENCQAMYAAQAAKTPVPTPVQEREYPKPPRATEQDFPKPAPRQTPKAKRPKRPLYFDPCDDYDPCYCR